MTDRKTWLLLVVLWGAALRLSGVAWDGFTYQHPDERFVLMEALKLEAPRSLAEALDPWQTPTNPNNRGTKFFVYGALPLQLLRAFTTPFGLNRLGELLPAARLLTTFVDLIAMLLLMTMARRLVGVRGMLLAGVLYGSAPLLVQQARFATVDVWGTTLVVAAAWEVVGWPVTLARVLRAGLWVGLAVACKPNLAMAGLLPLVAVAVAARRRSGKWMVLLGWVVAALAVLGTAALVAVKLADPGVFDGVLSLRPNPRRLAALQQLAWYFEGGGQYPPNLQWADRLPVLEPLANLLIWGTGPLLGVVVVLGVARVAGRALLGETRWWPVLAFAVPALVWPLTRFVSSVRHFEPVLPFAVLAGAWWLARRRRWVRALVVGGTMLWGLAWASIAWRPHTRVEASRWLHDNLPAGAVVTAEYWDDALPLGRGHGLEQVTMRVFDPDTAAKREAMLAALELADAVVLASQRGVGSICRVPDAYPLTSEYYHLLFSGALGFRPAASFTRRLGPLSTLSAEESLSVYDHPPVWVFVKTAAYSSELARALLERVPLPPSMSWQTGELEARGVPPYRERWQERGRLPAARGRSAMAMVASLLLWVASIEVLGLSAGRVVRVLARSAPDLGWGVARWLGLTLVGVGWLWFGWAKVPGWNTWLPTVALALALPWAWAEGRRAWRDAAWRTNAAVVWGVWTIFLLLRLANPEIFWGEKAMNSALLHGVLRSATLPPVDPWFAGAPLNDYFFGLLPHAFLLRALGIEPLVAYNLMAATVPALAAGAASSVGWLLAGRTAGGLLAAAVVPLAGTAAVMARPQELLLHPSFAGFWASSRVIPGTINEFPVWTALFGDLHAHFLAFPGFLAAVWAVSLVGCGRLRGRWATLAVGGAVGVQAMSNTWELPGLAGMALLAAGSLGAAAPSRRLVIWLRFLAGAAGVAFLVSLPYWLSVRPAAGGVRWGASVSPSVAQLTELFGVSGGLLLVAVVATLFAGARRGQPRCAWLLVAGGVAAVLAPFLVTVGDSMNTVFKLHFQAHLLLGVSVAGILGAAVPELRGWRRAVCATGVALALGIGLLTAAGCAAGLLSARLVVGPRPTLDGAAYLTAVAPGRREVLAAVAALPYGATVYERVGAPYSQSLWVPMFTGLPVPVGWRYHLWQRRHAFAEIDLRLRDMGELAHGRDERVIEALLQRYRITAAVSWGGEELALARTPRWQERARRGLAVAWHREPQSR